MKTSEQVNEISDAMAKAQGSMKPVKKSKEVVVTPKNGGRQYTYMYAEFEDCVECIRLPSLENKLGRTFDVSMGSVGNHFGALVSLRITHSSGQWFEYGPIFMPASEITPQKLGSCVTFAKRYLLCAAFCISADEDDDASSIEPSVQDAKDVQIDKKASKTVSLQPPADIISDEEKTALYAVLSQCDQKFPKLIEDTLKRDYGVDSISKMPKKEYEKFLKAAKENAANKKRGAAYEAKRESLQANGVGQHS